MIPYADDTPSYSIPVWVFLLIFVNVVFFFSSISEGPDNYLRTIFSYGTIPARFFHEQTEPLRIRDKEAGIDLGYLDQSKLPVPILTLITAMFLHGGLGHLIGNMWFLWIFGDNVEDRLGKLLFPIFYITSGIVAGLLHVLLYKNSVLPAIGASGAIAGVMGAYLYMFPRSTVATIWGFGFYWRVIHIPGSFYLVIWFLLQLIPGLAGGGASNVAFMAHVGGFAAGFLLAVLFDSLKVITWWPGDRGMPDSSVPAFFDDF